MEIKLSGSYTDDWGQVYDVAFSVTPRSIPPAPPEHDAPILWGVAMEGVPWDMSKLAALETQVGKTASLVHWWHTWDKSGGYRAFAPSVPDAVIAHGAVPLMSWASQGGDAARWALRKIIDHYHDAYIRQFAQDVREWEQELYIRWGHEMNGRWGFTWQEGENGNAPGEFVQAWRHIVDIFREEKAYNVVFVWCPDAGPDFVNYYPGDDYVDVIGLDGYNWGFDEWKTFGEVFGPALAAIDNDAPPYLPIWICETGCAEDGGDKAAWITDMLGAYLPAHPAIEALCWYDFEMDGRDWRIGTSPASLAAWRAGIAADYYAPAEEV